ncbi:MAG: hypothetical protein ACOC8E_02785 [Planctomycetota bacterium]
MKAMKNTLWLVALAGVFTASCDARQEAATADEPPGLPRAEWDAYGYRQVRAPRSEAANFEVAAPALPAGAELRFLFNLQPAAEEEEYQNYYFVSARPSGLTLGKVECGIEMPLAAWRPEGESPFAEPRTVTVMRRRSSIGVAVDRRRVLRVSDETFDGGLAAVGVRGMPEGAAEPEARSRYVGEIYAQDDFMRTAEEAGAWRTIAGKWKPKFPNNPGLSANAFVFVGRPAGDDAGIAVMGQPWWDDYAVEVAAKPVGCTAFGLLFRYVDPANHYLVRHKELSSARFLQLVRVREGEETVLGQRKVRLGTDQWYQLEVVASGHRLTVRLDGHEFFDERDDALAFGQVGLYVADPNGRNDGIGAEFDDLMVRGESAWRDRFEGDRLAWSAKGGTWALAADRLRATGPDGSNGVPYGKLLGGSDTWANYRVACILLPGATGPVGVIARYRDELNHDAFELDPRTGECRLVRVRGGRRTTPVRADLPAPETRCELSLACRHGVLIAAIDGRRVLSHFDDSLRRGKAGLLVGKGARAEFDRLAVEFLPGQDAALTYVDAFAHERTMKDWAAPGSDWSRAATTVRGRTRSVWWHRTDFLGDVGARVGADFPSRAAGTLRIYTCCSGDSPRALRTGGGTVAGGYELAVTTPAHQGKGQVALYRNGRRVQEREIPALRRAHHIGLRRVEGYLLAEIDDRVVFSYRDPSPVSGYAVGYATEGVEVAPENIELFCENRLLYAFVRAMTDWRTAGGTWEVTNRWQCDKRWSFVCGKNLDGVSAIWNKRRFRGDLTLEYAVGIQHRGGGGGGYGRYVRDMNAVICGDGRTLNSGYGFIYGGWDNTRSAITRNGKVVAETSTPIPTGGFHRRWFYCKVVKRGGHLEFYVDNNLLLEYEDPDPLPGGQVALWTWKNGLMVGRVRITAERIRAEEGLAEAYPSVSDSIYDN